MTNSLTRLLVDVETADRVPRTCVTDQSYRACPFRDLIRKLLVKDPTARLTASQALVHPWFEKVIRGGMLRDSVLTRENVDEAALQAPCSVSSALSLVLGLGRMTCVIVLEN